ncbi:Translation factor GUF1 -like protein, mitochondrial [Plasmodiophora brassicae]|uniref:Translation factor GUF1 homolog, mitochondrial n=1 Tax=Plasmodiophora brassicae TaxID=37360 RepID=A0A3P3XYF9_PLABS|nr:unnamed protein product [Plasmodiophora brassicae]
MRAVRAGWRRHRLLSTAAAGGSVVGRADLSVVTGMVTDPDLDPTRIRSFCIIAHVDHGKSTLADRLLEATGNIPKITPGQEVRCQVLDTLQVERERGITVKAQHASMAYKGLLLQLIDTPGHVDFSHEVLRSVSACEGAVLAVDSAQGLQAQTLAVCNLAKSAGLDLIPVLTKCDLPTSQPSRVIEQMFNAFDIDPDAVIQTSAKTGMGVADVLDAVVGHVRSPVPHVPTRESGGRALIVDSWFDVYRGAICLVKIDCGQISVGDRIAIYHARSAYEVQEVGIVTPSAVSTGVLRAGQVGYIIAGVKDLNHLGLGDTVFTVEDSQVKASRVSTTVPESTFNSVVPLPGFSRPKSMVWASVYPVDSDDFDALQDAFSKLTMNDISLHVKKEISLALGTGFRCGLLGVLHLEVLKDRLQTEFGIDTIVTAPIVPYTAIMNSGDEIIVSTPSDFPDPAKVREYFEPFIMATIICPEQYMGRVQELCKDRRGVHQSVQFLDNASVLLKYRIPMSEIVNDFYSQIKSLSAGYASFDYEDAGLDKADLVMLDILLNGKPVDALSTVCVRDNSHEVGKGIASRLKANIKRQSFEVVIQAAIGSKIVARERIPPFRKDVLTKSGKTVGGGDKTRKMKLLQKQKEGKKKMKTIGNIEVPQAAFLSVLSSKDPS